MTKQIFFCRILLLRVVRLLSNVVYRCGLVVCMCACVYLFVRETEIVIVCTMTENVRIPFAFAILHSR